MNSVHMYKHSVHARYLWSVIPPNAGVNKHEFVASCFLPSRQLLWYATSAAVVSAVGQQSQTWSWRASCCNFPACETVANFFLKVESVVQSGAGQRASGVCECSQFIVVWPPLLILTNQLFLTLTFTQVYRSFTFLTSVGFSCANLSFCSLKTPPHTSEC